MIYENHWRDYGLLDTSDKNRLERWGKYILIRPDPQVIWSGKKAAQWRTADAVYMRSASGGGNWKQNRPLPESWVIGYEPLGMKFKVSPMGFKHTGVFPEQAVNWRFMHGALAAAKEAEPSRVLNVLNLFAYTGGATLACAKAGAQVCHVDAQRNINETARENAAMSGLAEAKIRYITDDCFKFVQRELRRGSRYDAVVLDPPSFGRGASGEMWKIEEHLFPLLHSIAQLLSDRPVFVQINLYTAGLAPSCAGYMLDMLLKPNLGGRVEADEIGIFCESTGAPFPCGAFARWLR